MKSKTISGWSEKGFDKKVNEFIEDPSREIIEVQFSTPLFFYSAYILYEEKAEYLHEK